LRRSSSLRRPHQLALVTLQISLNKGNAVQPTPQRAEKK
jgi:hypothetical protein